MTLRPLPALHDNYIWLLADTAGHAVVIDPGEAEPVLQALQAEHLQLHAILLTHHHHDHIGGVAELLAEHHAAVYAPRDERITHATRRVADGDRVCMSMPDLAFTVIAVPGHTRSHVAYYGHGLLFCGDTLFSLGCGRLFEGTAAQMLDSLDRLRDLPDSTQVCCAHEYTRANAAFARTVDPHNQALSRRSVEIDALRAHDLPTVPTTLRDERACNPFLRSDSPAVVAWSTLPGAEQRVARFAALRTAKDAFIG